MRRPPRPRPLLDQVIWWIVLPLALIAFGSVGAGVLAYRRTITSLLIDRDRQLATLSARHVSEAVEGYARVLETLAANTGLRQADEAARRAILEQASEALDIFTGGVLLVDAAGQVVVSAPAAAVPLGASLAAEAFFADLRQRRGPAFSDVLADARTGQDMIVIAVSLHNETGAFAGALCGVIHLHNTPLGEPVRRLNVGDEGFAYLVDGRGRVIFHPDAALIGADFTDRPFVQRVMAGESGGALWTTPSGERVVQGYAPVEATGWGLVIREPWEVVVAPAGTYALLATPAGLAAVAAAVLLVWRGARRITRPVRRLAAQSHRLASGEPVEALAESGVLEINQLEQAFTEMAAQIANYRAGLRRYVGALTTAREADQRRVARELHDETTQNLLAILRRIELYQAQAAPAAEQQARLDELRQLVEATLDGVRQISRDLRPLALEDLGLVPALRTLIQNWQRADPAHPRQVDLEVEGAAALSPDQELALYRIAQEALTNVGKHAQAGQVKLRLAFANGHVSLAVHDDGRGFHAPDSLAELAQGGHYGLLGMQERVWSVGGTLEVDSAPGRGTRLAAHLPLHPPASGV